MPCRSCQRVSRRRKRPENKRRPVEYPEPDGVTTSSGAFYPRCNMTKAELFKVLKDVPDDEEIFLDLECDINCITRDDRVILATSIDSFSLSNHQILYFSSLHCDHFGSDPADFTNWIHRLNDDKDL